ncbi:hypothetical protein SAMN05877753_11016 [Bacillus oleivorans]|uniref:Uncharacterized protein n=1 Tax=Bacillus oleivorans TaxID=1448271 RepID=A0A285D4S6_9BACI|nr:hypothetical protein [Bacillus oleivorans]SNX74695.1 hypothetical protein SAMN05877753_11016 [Bacillus oleivorans]
MLGNNWRSVLEKICDIYFQAGTKIDWILVGSAGSVLQGCDMEPGDIDIYVKEQEGAAKFAELLREFSLTETSENRESHTWLSSKDEPVFHQTFPSGFSWSKARWVIDGVDVEVVHISNSAGIPDSTTGEGIWEGGKYIWALSKNVEFGNFTIPVVPLEIQLESNFRRNRQDRAEAIITALKRDGFDEQLLRKALSSPHLAAFFKRMWQSKSLDHK